jgi:hypothetical protein
MDPSAERTIRFGIPLAEDSSSQLTRPYQVRPHVPEHIAQWRTGVADRGEQWTYPAAFHSFSAGKSPSPHLHSRHRRRIPRRRPCSSPTSVDACCVAATSSRRRASQGTSAESSAGVVAVLPLAGSALRHRTRPAGQASGSAHAKPMKLQTFQRLRTLGGELVA